MFYLLMNRKQLTRLIKFFNFTKMSHSNIIYHICIDISIQNISCLSKLHWVSMLLVYSFLNFLKARSIYFLCLWSFLRSVILYKNLRFWLIQNTFLNDQKACLLTHVPKQRKSCVRHGWDASLCNSLTMVVHALALQEGDEESQNWLWHYNWDPLCAPSIFSKL